MTQDILTRFNPSTGKPVSSLACTRPENLRAAVKDARQAQDAWQKSAIEQRVEVATKFAQALTENADSWAKTLCQETGKPIAQARGEIRATAGRVQFFCDHVQEALADKTVRAKSDGSLTELISREPLGLVGNISAWNYPYFVGSNVYIPALLCGNAVLYKPSEFAASSGLIMAEALAEAGLPEKLFQVILGGGETGAQLLEQALQAMFFTGSYNTGLKIAAAAAKRLMKVQLELGGKDPVYVSSDVDIEKTAQAVAEGAFYNTGQSCCSVERVYVHADVASDFTEAFESAVKAMTIGDPMDENTFIGPLTREAQLAVLEDQAKDAEAKSAKRIVGSGRRLERPGYYFDPTVFVDCEQNLKLMREESFGPIIGLRTVSSDEQALELMNDTDYGLTASVYCRDEARARAILGGVHAGSVYWNCCDRVSPFLPWSGRRQSGLGLTLSLEGLTTFTQPKAWHLRQH